MWIKIPALLFCLLLSTYLNAQPSEDSIVIAKNDIAVGIDLIPLVGNFPRIMFSVNYTWKKQLGIEFGAGPVWGTEQYFWGEDVDHNSGFSYNALAKWSFELNDLSRPYVGLGYFFVRTEFDASYVVRNDIGGLTFFQNFNQRFDMENEVFFLAIGIRISEGLFFTEPFILVNLYDNASTIEAPSVGVVVDNEEIFEERFYPYPLFLGLKVGLVFNW